MWRMWSDRPCPDTSRAGGWIRWLRVTRGLSAVEVADRADISTQFIYELERGKKRLNSTEKALRLADALNQDPLRFMLRILVDILEDQEIYVPEIGERV
ncbi:helix-turn-helix domain-containing protein [Amycolatopsis sp. cmx-11-12]|uniref:helix-turn-helix domain-containing protein n=1 Tax=Amycolatopsis sp. cmx-11-12 TaxID=2785795 RepID=UPI0039175B7A